MISLSDEQLAEALAAGDAGGLREAFRRYGPAVAAMAGVMASSAEERSAIVEDAFAALWERAPGFDGTRVSFRTWFLTMAHRRAAMRIRKASSAAGGSVAERPSAAALLEELELPVSRPEDRELLLEAFFGVRTVSEVGRRARLSEEAAVRGLRRALGELVAEAGRVLS